MSVELKMFTAKWCGPCQQMKRLMMRLEEVGYPIEIVDIEERQTLAESNNISAVPTTIIFNDNVEVEKMMGFKSVAEVLARLHMYMEPLELPKEFTDAS